MNFSPLPVPAAQLGESPLWHPSEQVLYWCDIPGGQVHRFDPRSGAHRGYQVGGEPACLVPLLGGGLLVAARRGLLRLDTGSGQLEALAEPPYDPATQRFNDGKADPLGRLWVTTLDDARQPRAALWRWDAGSGFACMASGLANGNAVAISPDGRTLTLADTAAHTLWRYELDLAAGTLAQRRVLAMFAPKPPSGHLAGYGGRPDGAAMDSEGALWLALYEGARLLRLAPGGRTLGEWPLPVQCPTMPCFGGHDLKTLYLTTAAKGRPADELARQPWAGGVLQMPVEVAGLPANFLRA